MKTIKQSQEEILNIAGDMEAFRQVRDNFDFSESGAYSGEDVEVKFENKLIHFNFRADITITPARFKGDYMSPPDPDTIEIKVHEVEILDVFSEKTLDIMPNITEKIKGVYNVDYCEQDY